MDSIAEIDKRLDEVRGRLSELDADHRGAVMPAEAASEWNDLNGEFDSLTEKRGELVARSDRLAAIAVDPANREDAPAAVAAFHTGRAGVARTATDIYDLSTIRTSLVDEDGMNRELRDRAERSIELEAIPSEAAGQSEAVSKENAQRLLHRFDDDGYISRRILTTGSELYRRAWLKAIAGAHLNDAENRALSLTGEKGGFAVPYQLDPTVILTSSGAINPIREIARVEQVTVDTWKGLSTEGVTAAYSAEAAETEEAALSFAQPEVSTERASVLILASFEITQDWAGISGELSRIISDAKDVLEAEKFLTGTGTNEPFGILTGAVETVNTATTEIFAVADVYALKAALPPRFRPNAKWLANDAIYDRIRQFDTGGGGGLWVQLGEGRPAELLGKPIYELSTMNAEIKANKLNAIYGDFSKYLIAERIGMGIEVIPHVMNGKKATGQRGFYAFWRNGAKVLAKQAFRVMKGK